MTAARGNGYLMLSDKHLQVSLTTAFAWSLWSAVVAFLALGYLTSNSILAYVGLACSAAAATVHMRSFICVLSNRMQAAFDLGREVERERQSDLRSVR